MSGWCELDKRRASGDPCLFVDGSFVRNGMLFLDAKLQLLSEQLMRLMSVGMGLEWGKWVSATNVARAVSSHLTKKRPCRGTYPPGHSSCYDVALVTGQRPTITALRWPWALHRGNRGATQLQWCFIRGIQAWKNNICSARPPVTKTS